MRHNKKFNHLGRTASHRNAMLANMACSLIKHKRITTTVAKAKALKKFVEPLITKSKDDTTNSRRVVCVSSNWLIMMKTWLRQLLLRRHVLVVLRRMLKLLLQKKLLRLNNLYQTIYRIKGCNESYSLYFLYLFISGRYFLM